MTIPHNQVFALARTDGSVGPTADDTTRFSGRRLHGAPVQEYFAVLGYFRGLQAGKFRIALLRRIR